MTHDHPDKIIDRSNADVGPNSYHQYEEDIKALKETGVRNCHIMLQTLPNEEYIYRSISIDSQYLGPGYFQMVMLLP